MLRQQHKVINLNPKIKIKMIKLNKNKKIKMKGAQTHEMNFPHHKSFFHLRIT